MTTVQEEYLSDNTVVLVDDFLEQFGVKGMHWGIRKSPEEIAKRTAKREEKAQKFVKKANVLETRISERQRSRNPIGRRRAIKNLREEQTRALLNAERKRQGKFSIGQRRAVIGASAAGAILAAGATYQSLNSGNARRLITKGKMFVTRNKVPFKVDNSLADPNLSADSIMSKVVKHINPNYGERGTKMNCRRATFAYEMRRRGYDVAATRTPTGRGQDITGQFNVLNPGANLVPPGISGVLTRRLGESRKASKPFTQTMQSKTFLGENKINIVSDTVNVLSKHPDGARGELGMKFIGGGGHSMAWEKIKGQITIFDNQTGKKYTPSQFNEIIPNLTETGYTRLDNVPLNHDFLLRWLKDA